jgi:hypothetical protein
MGFLLLIDFIMEFLKMPFLILIIKQKTVSDKVREFSNLES